MPNALALRLRAVIAMVATIAIVVYAFGALIASASAAGLDRPSHPCHTTMHQDRDAGHVEGRTSNDRHAASADTGSAKPDARPGKRFPHGGPDCPFSCSLAVTPRAASFFTFRMGVATAFDEREQRADDYLASKHGRPPKPLA